MSDHLFRPQRGGTERVIRWVISDHPLITHLITLPFSSSRRPRGHAPGASATTLQFYEPQSHSPGATGPGQWLSAWSRRIRAQLLASATSPHTKGPSSAHMGAHPSGPLERTVNNYFVAGCMKRTWYFGARANDPQYQYSHRNLMYLLLRQSDQTVAIRWFTRFLRSMWGACT